MEIHFENYIMWSNILSEVIQHITGIMHVWLTYSCLSGFIRNITGIVHFLLSLLSPSLSMWRCHLLPGCLQAQDSGLGSSLLCCVGLGCLGLGRRSIFGASRVSCWWKSLRCARQLGRLDFLPERVVFVVELGLLVLLLEMFHPGVVHKEFSSIALCLSPGSLWSLSWPWVGLSVAFPVGIPGTSQDHCRFSVQWGVFQSLFPHGLDWASGWYWWRSHSGVER